ncbi:hypothetical protein BJ508DRAFT_333541 [Ascobolus immersus RN42]|uniref:Uncharacterized protein n=1 Tax=Ascobolus immersus RN42 TaxID=1160509 RepID=A0A3N4HWB1_ASCIM|nr:hypothetical protein BJ508DRAFT_333541 [Ascobolus immersus RN42]
MTPLTFHNNSIDKPLTTTTNSKSTVTDLMTTTPMPEANKGMSLPIRYQFASLIFAGGSSELQPFRFLDLLPELRLEVYSRCSILSLFLLTQTCIAIYTDINTRKGLVKRCAGYSQYQPSSQPHPMFPANAIPLTIPMMAHADCLEDIRPGVYHENELFNWLYGDCKNGDCRAKCWWAFMTCYLVKFTEDFNYWADGTDPRKHSQHWRALVQERECKECRAKWYKARPRPRVNRLWMLG